ncbi:MAG: chemotaxis protein CheW [Promethearchaeota archaeon]
MSSKEDMKLFFSEAEDLIQNIEENILNLEDNPRNDQPVQNLFFIYHTLKGMTAMVGLENLSKFCHHFETFLEKNKEYKERVKRKGEVINFLFKSLDIIRTTINRVKSGEINDLGHQILGEITDTFDDFETAYEITFFKPISLNELNNAISNKAINFFKIYIQIQETCVFKKVRLFIIFRALNKIGRICSSKPEPELLERGNFDTDFEIYFMSQRTSSDIDNILSEILEIENKVITRISANEFYEIVSNFTQKYGNIEERKLYIEKEEEKLIEQNIGGVSSIVDEFTSTVSKITSVKVNIETLEQLMDYFGELVIIKNQLTQILKERQNWEGARFFDNMDKLFLEIQEIIFKLKLVRVETTFRKYRRLVRDVAKETGKEVRFILEGLDVEIDRKVLEELNSPLIHLLRNAIYHGVESPREREMMNKSIAGNLKLRTYRRAGSVYIEVEDDGKGLNYEKIRQIAIEKGFYTTEEAMELTKEELINVIFIPGFSTLPGADQISGRGIGLAIVREKIAELGGSIDIHSDEGVGTKFTLDVPFTRAILKAQLFKVNGDLFAIPIENIKQIYFFKRELIEYVKGVEHYRIEQKLIPVIHLNQFLQFLIKPKEDDEKETNSNAKIAVWCIKDEDESAVFVIDEILQQMELVIKPFRSKFSKFQEILGVTITGEGSICLIIDVLNIISSLSKKVKGFQLAEIPRQS